MLKVRSDMERLVNKCVQPIPLPCFINFQKYITIALLNVRSIINKVVDIKHDSILQAADVLCFCETWLKPSDPTPCVKPNHNVERCDRVSGRGGGLLVSIPNTMQYVRLNNIITTNGIDLLNFSLECNNVQMMMYLIYRPPLVSLNYLLSIVSHIVSATSNTVQPIIVLGDFNEDMSSNRNSPLVALMTNNGFTQHVKYPTMDRGTMIDLVFVKNLSLPITIDVKDTYYSDHDIVFLTINLFQSVTKCLPVSGNENKKQGTVNVPSLQMSMCNKQRIVNVPSVSMHNNTVSSQFR